MNKDFNFDDDFSTDEDVERMLNYIATIAKESKSDSKEKISVVNPQRMEQFLYTYKVLKYLTKGVKGTKVTYELYEPFESMGSISIVGKELFFKKSKWFMKAVEFATNFEVYPKTDGTVQMNFTFHKLVMPIN